MNNLEIPINTIIELVEDIASLDLDYMMIPSGTLGKIEAYERNLHNGEIIGYYATIYGVYEEFLYLDPWELEVADEWVDRFVDSILIRIE